MFTVVCTKCGSVRESDLQWRCSCDGTYIIESDVHFEKKHIVEGDHSLWRYRRFLPFSEDVLPVTMGEGSTSIVKMKAPNLFAKLDFIMPTGSYKDRGSTVLITHIRDVISKTELKKVAEDSSGNGGASVAAYCARAGLKCQIFSSIRVTSAKASQITAYGASLRRISGSRDDISRAAQNEPDSLYIGHVWNPYFIEGIKTIPYETVEFMNWQAPDYIFTPTSAGTLLLGIIKGLRHLQESSIIDRIPTIVSVQAEQVSPIYHAFHRLQYTPPKEVTTIADALITTHPIRGGEMVQALKEVNGDVEIVSDEELIESQTILAQEGFYVEPSSASVYAAWRKWIEKGRIPIDRTVLLILTGSGLKSAQPLRGS